MGLKTTNYEIKKLGITLPTAYAIIKNVEVHGTIGKALFHIQTSRENTNLQPFEKVYFDFKVNRNESPYITAYRLAKQDEVALKRNPKFDHRKSASEQSEPEFIEVRTPAPFSGWQDDIL